MIAVGHSDRAPEPRYLELRRALMNANAAFRNFGSAALQLAHVAEGRLDGYVEFELSSWDAMAGCCWSRRRAAASRRFPGRAGLTVKAPVVAAAAGDFRCAVGAGAAGDRRRIASQVELLLRYRLTRHSPPLSLNFCVVVSVLEPFASLVVVFVVKVAVVTIDNEHAASLHRGGELLLRGRHQLGHAGHLGPVLRRHRLPLFLHFLRRKLVGLVEIAGVNEAHLLDRDLAARMVEDRRALDLGGSVSGFADAAQGWAAGRRWKTSASCAGSSVPHLANVPA